MKRTTVHQGSGNVFKDLGFPNPEEAQFKSGLVALIGRQIRARKLTQAQAGKILGVGQPKVSDMLRGHFHGYSVERLLGFLRRLGKGVEIRVRDSHEKLGHLRLSA
jgi:predicted XRE-type DNA-binding protein